ncbi:MAG: Thiol-disulfide isomerase or thioredoxin [Chloroflexi bacterium]|jgi:thiol-disulfide isomerase/thioredoxin|nr:MAG: Thiol-disulfide isomerase or thioredoxin [Chloroflexota bacterium]
MNRVRPAFVFLSLVAAAMLTLAACGGAEPTATPDPTATAFPVDPDAAPGSVGSLVPELEEVAGWINTEPFAMSDLRGKVVLIDVWTYTCINCLRTLPYLKDWYAKYEDLGLEIVGVHSPEFEFEKVKENVEAAVAKHGLDWRVVQDNDFGTWRALNNAAWPARTRTGLSGTPTLGRAVTTKLSSKSVSCWRKAALTCRP